VKSFKEYVEHTKENEVQTEPLSTEPNGEEKQRAARALGEQIAAAYNGKSDMQMWQSIIAEAEKGKRNGTLSNEDIERFYQTFSSMVNGVQRKKLRAVVDRLKKLE
jgi:hypothetical protein